MVVVAAVPMVLVVVATSGCGGSDNGIGCSGDGDNGGGVGSCANSGDGVGGSGNDHCQM